MGITLPENKNSIQLLERLGLKFQRYVDKDNEQLAVYAINIQ
ncbi:hypothetical protein U0035_14250 [Niabella yanshanensis]|uniref:GNAT family N-acetyltransferase n=1 Tax=Niabella yanshanensis TaxID=577386 RepID=A0ABZ0W0P1_9BACT|nr:hypothetical protein [Niabella yanshanensis]WQD36830.1 hypothetical protein U0035_14250 [Niabella yanshanensis]